MFKKTTLAMLFGSLLIGCSGGGSGSSDAGDKTPPANDLVSISGIAVKGILAGAIVEAYDISGSTLLAETTTDASGRYTLPAIDHNGPILVKLKTSSTTKATCDSAIGCKDADGNPVAFGGIYSFNDSDFTLSALLPDADAAAQQELMVTPVTHMAAERAIATGATTAADVDASNRATAQLLGLDGIDINTVTPVDITDPNATNSATAQQQLYATLVASIQTLAEQDPDSSIADVINTLADDYSADGGLVGNSADETKITLENIFSAAAEVVTAAEDKATDEGVILDLDNAETLLALAETEAKEEEPDAEVVIPTDPNVPVDPVATLETATAKGIALLEDLNLWQDALQADNQHMVQPFENQLEGTEAILTSLDSSSKILQGVHSLVAETNSISDCADINDANNSCYYADEFGVFKDGPVVDALANTVDLIALTSLLQDTLADNTPDSTGNTFDYNAQLDTGINYQPITDSHSYNGIFYGTLTATYSVKENKISRIEYFREISPISYRVSFTQTDFADDGLTIAFNILPSTLNLPDQGLTLMIKSGEAAITFTSAQARIAFSNYDSELDPSLAEVSSININLNTETSEIPTGDIASNNDSIEMNTDILVSFDFDKAADNSTTTVIDLALDASNTLGENINGDFTLTANGNFNEEEVAGVGFSPAFDLTNAIAQFNGDISLSTTTDAGLEHSASFTGQVNAEAAFLSANQDVELVADTGSADFDGAITINEGADSLVFEGRAEVFMEAVKTPEGIPFNLKDGTEYHANKATLFGKLTASKDDGASLASLEINAAVTADISGVDFISPDSIQYDDKVATLALGLTSTGPDNALYYINYADALNEVKQTLNNKGFEIQHIETWPSTNNFNMTFQSSNCSDSEDASFQFCDITKTYANKAYHSFQSPMTDAEKVDFMNNGQVPDYKDRPAFDTPTTQSSLSEANTQVGSECYSYEEGSESCNVTIEYTSSYELSNALISSGRGINYIKGLDAQNDPAAGIDVSAQCDAAEDDYKNCQITKTTQGSFNTIEALPAEEKHIMLIGDLNYLSRHSNSAICDFDASNCTINFSEDTYFVSIWNGANMTESEQLAAAVEYHYVPDYFGQMASDGISLSGCVVNGENLECSLVYAATDVVITPSASFFNAYLHDQYGIDDNAQRYLRGLYAEPVSEYEITQCDGSQCDYVSTERSGDIFTAELTETEISISTLGQQYHKDYYELGACIENSCAVNLNTSKSIAFPTGLSTTDRETYIARIIDGRGVDNSTYILESCNSYPNGSSYCRFSQNVSHTAFAQVIDANAGGITQYASTYIAASEYDLPHPEVWAGITTQYGYVAVHMYGPSSISALNGQTGEVAGNVRIRRFSPNFNAFNFDTEEAYIEVSAALSVKAQITGLDSAELIVTADRLGFEDGSATVQLINGTRAITLNIDSTKGFADSEGFNLMINNNDTEMTITATCATDSTDEGINDRPLIDACEDGFNFKGDIFVDDFKVADLEDRNGLPVFRFSDGSGRDLVATPNLLFAPSAP